MTFIGNVLWFGGIWPGLSWVMAGVLRCCTIVGIPFGVACFRIAGFWLALGSALLGVGIGPCDVAELNFC